MNKIYIGKSNIQSQYPTHSHEDWEIISNIEGGGILQFDCGEFPFAEHTVICIPPYTVHTARGNPFFRDIFLSCPEFPALDRTKPTILSDDCDGNITSLMRVLYSVQYSKAQNINETMSLLTDSIQQLILSRIERNIPDKRVEMIVNQIIHHFHEPDFSLASCISKSSYCADYIRRLFSAQLGKTPNEYLLELRIKNAKRLLATRFVSNYSIGEIANMVGFKDASYFSRVFKKATGVCPEKYIDGNS